jgi:hypothetical protein
VHTLCVLFFPAALPPLPTVPLRGRAAENCSVGPAGSAIGPRAGGFGDLERARARSGGEGGKEGGAISHRFFSLPPCLRRAAPRRNADASPSPATATDRMGRRRDLPRREIQSRSQLPRHPRAARAAAGPRARAPASPMNDRGGARLDGQAGPGGGAGPAAPLARGARCAVAAPRVCFFPLVLTTPLPARPRCACPPYCAPT